MKFPFQCLAFVVLLLAVSINNSRAQQRKGAGARPAQARPAARPVPSYKPSAKPSPSGRPVTRPNQNYRPGARPSTSRPGTYPGGRPGTYPGGRPGYNNQTAGNRRPGGNNNVNINVNYSNNVRIYNTRNTIVRKNIYRPAYARPPYRWGGYRYHCHRPYYYHPYRPYYWGPRWRPWGFFLTTLAATAIIVSFADADLPDEIHLNNYFVYGVGILDDQSARPLRGWVLSDSQGPTEQLPVQDGEYYYDEGVFYLKGDDGYTVVAAPVGGIVKSLPDGYETISLDEEGKVKNYYYGGAFYEKVSKGYKVVEATAGVTVSNLPEGGEEVKAGDITYVKIGETYYQPVQQNGKNVYEVVDVEEDK